jgi:hypothetical protein
MLDKILALLAVLLFWLPGIAVTAFSVRGVIHLIKPPLEGAPAKHPLLLPALALGLSIVGVVAACFVLAGYAIGTGQGGYTAPLENFLFNVTFLTPIFFAVPALLSSVAWLVTAFVKR